MGFAVGAVFVALPAFVLDDVALEAEAFLVEGVQQVAHAVGLEPENEFEGVGGCGRPVVGAVVGGGAVDARADLFEGFEEVAVVMLGSFEHDVFEEVGESGASRLFVF